MAGKDREGASSDVGSSVISTAPAPGASRVASSPLTVDVIRDPAEGMALYWCGTLLMEGDFDFEVPATLQEIDGGIVSEGDDGGFCKPIKTTAWKQWYPGPGKPSFWAARNRYFQQLDVTGLSFPAFSEERGRDAANEDVGHKYAWPGCIFAMSDSDIKRVLESVQNHAIRPLGPAWHSFPGAKVVNYKHAHMPGCPGGRLLTAPYCQKCEDIEKAIADSKNERLLPQRNQDPEYRHREDLPISDFIYLLKLGASWDTPRDLYTSLVPTMAEFIKKQPPSLSRDLNKAPKGGAA